MDLMKKTLSLVLAVLMAVSVFAGIQITAEAAYGRVPYVYATVTEPVVGAKPDFSATVSSQYPGQVSNSHRYGDNMIDGVEWYDVTAQKSLGANDTFLAGHQYNVGILITCGTDYRFKHDNQPSYFTFNGKYDGDGYYYTADGYTDNELYYFVHCTFDALPDTGWYYKDGASYYYKDGYLQKNKLVKDSTGDWYYADENGKMFRGWKKFGSDMRYFDYSTGVMATGLKKASNGNWYYFASNGFRQYGLQKINGKWRYFDTSTGVMAKGWVKFGTNFRYFDKSTGVMATGLIKADNGNWYFFNGSGIRQYGWQKFGSNWRYFQSNGVMLANCTKQIDGKNCTFNSSGILTSRVAVSTSSSTSTSHKIYATKTGKKYHYNNNCNGGSYYEITLSEAKSRGLTPCEKCVH